MRADGLQKLMRWGQCGCAAILLLALPQSVPAQGKTAGEAAAPGRNGFVITPVVSYAPETLIAWGFAGIHYFQFGRSILPTRLSHYRFNLIFTQKKQTIAQIDYELHLASGKIILSGQAKYALYPDRFYGIGNLSAKGSREDYNARNWRLQMNAQRRWGDNMFSGLRLEVFTQDVIETESDSLLAADRAGPDAVEIGARRLDPARVLLWVEDRGAGVAAADLPHVFEPYYTTKRTGTGLGLAIARKVVEALGGSIRMESREGEGTRVEIELPAAGPATEGAR